MYLNPASPSPRRDGFQPSITGGCDWNWVEVKTDFAAKRSRPLAGGNVPGSPGKQGAPRRGAGRPWNKRGFRRPAGAGFVFAGVPGALPPASGRRPFGPLMRGTQNGGNARFVFVQPHPVSITPITRGTIPRALPWAGMDRTFGAQTRSSG